MVILLKDERRTARKFYDCDASELWRRYGPPREALTADELLVLQGVEVDRWKIRAGQRYRCVVYRDGRELVTQRPRLDMDALCQRHELYDDA